MDTTAPAPWRRYLRWIIAAAVLAAVVIAFKLNSGPPPVAVAVARVDSGRVEATVGNTRAGSVAACRRAKMAPVAAGRIARLPIKKGDRVPAGALLLELWNEDFTAREKVSRDQLLTARTRVDEACQLADAATSEAKRARELFSKGFVSEEKALRAEAEAKSRSATCASTKTLVTEAESRITASRADTERTVLRAPFAGIVAEINGELGEFLTPSPPGIPTLPAVDLIDDSCLYVTAPIDEVDAAKVKVGMTGRISLDAYRGTHFLGHVRRMAPYVLALEKQARTVEVEVEFEKDQKLDRLLVGYSADIEVVVEARDKVLRIPTPALMPGGRVLVLGDDGLLAERKVDTGLSNWERTEIKAGLKEGDRVVTSLERPGVKAGARATEETKPATAASTGNQ